MNRTTRRSLVMLVATPIMATGLFITAAPAEAKAAPGDATCSNSMAMPQTIADSGGPSLMTRAGQVAASTPAPRSDAAMASGCPAAGHG